MASVVVQDREILDEVVLEKILCERAKFYAFADRFRTLTIFDRQNGQFLLMDEGWQEFKHIHRVWLHVGKLRDGKFSDTEGRHGRRGGGGFDECGHSQRAHCACLSAPRPASVRRVCGELKF